MSGLEFRIQLPDGRGERLLVDTDTVLIGSGAHCEIRLPPEQAAIEHVLLRALPGGIFVQARFLSPPPTINGSPFTEAPLLPGSILGVGQVQIAVYPVEIADNANVIQKKKEQTSPMTYVLGAAAVGIYFFLLADPVSDDEIEPMPDAPALWGEPALVCPIAERDRALTLARDKKALAEAKRERHPFDIRDGVASVPLFETASGCFKVAGEPELAAETAAAAAVLRKTIEQEHRAHQRRLEHSIGVGDLRTAQKEVWILEAMHEGKSGAFIVWLSNLERKLALKLGRSGKRK